MLARRAESDGRLMHAAYYHRMSGFFLSNGVPGKDEACENFSRCFYASSEGENLELFDIPYEGYKLPAIRFKAKEEKGVVLLRSRA